MPTGYLYEELYGWWDTGTSAGFTPADPRLGLEPFRHYETPETKRRVHELIIVSGLIDSLTRLRTRAATYDEPAAVHETGYIDGTRAQSDSPYGGDGGDGGDTATRFGKGGFLIAGLAAGGAITLVDAVLEGVVVDR